MIIGDEHTFGKGTVQNIVDLPPGLGAIKVTTRLFYRPKGASTQNTGVRSDLIVASEFNRDDHGEKHQPYALKPHSIKAYASSVVQGKDADRWVPVTDKEIAKLKSQSSKRVKSNPELKKIRDDLAKYEKNKGLVTLKELLSEERKNEAEEEKEDEKPSPRRIEAPRFSQTSSTIEARMAAVTPHLMIQPVKILTPSPFAGIGTPPLGLTARS